MEKIIDEIFEELCALDGEFRAKEKETKEAILSIILARPEAALDENFKIKLKNQLLEKSRELQNKPALFNIFKFPNMNKLKIFYLSGSVIAVALLALAAGLPYLKTGKTTITANGIKISRVSEKAFGALTPIDNSGSPAPTAATAENASAPDRQMSAVSVSTGATKALDIGGGGGVASSDAAIGRAIAPVWMVNYRYVYNGPKIELKDKQVAILKRNKTLPVAGDFSRLLDNDFNLLDLSAFSGKRLQNISFLQPNDFGYLIDINLGEGFVSVSQNWEKWPRAKCQDARCYEALNLTADEAPSDAEVIKVADKFLSDYKINREFYGPGEIQDNWRVYYAAASDKASFMVPETTSVIYPLKIDGKEVYEYGGTKAGLTASVDAKFKKVSYLNGLTGQDYASSLYDAETDFDKILAIAEKGGYNNGYAYYDEANVKTETVELGEPRFIYLKHWIYESGRSGEEILVPALLFPIINKPKDSYVYRNNVIVPLATDLLGNNGGYPVPVPMMKGGAASSGSAGAEPAVQY